MTTPTPPRSGNSAATRGGGPMHASPTIRRWTVDEEEQLRDALGAHLPYRRIAHSLCRTFKAVRSHAYRIGEPITKNNGRSVSGTAALLGVGRRVVTRWIERGWLRARRSGGRVQMVSEERLLTFLAEPLYWCAWSSASITDAGLREWAQGVRAQERSYTTVEAGRVIGLTKARILQRIALGDIAAVRQVDGTWRISESALRAFQQGPLQTMRTYQRTPFDEGDVAFLREWRSVATVSELARGLDRPQSVVWIKCQKLGLTGPKDGGGPR